MCANDNHAQNISHSHTVKWLGSMHVRKQLTSISFHLFVCTRLWNKPDVTNNISYLIKGNWRRIWSFSVKDLKKYMVVIIAIGTASKLEIKKQECCWKVICMQNDLVEFLYWLSNPPLQGLEMKPGEQLLQTFSVVVNYLGTLGSRCVCSSRAHPCWLSGWQTDLQPAEPGVVVCSSLLARAAAPLYSMPVYRLLLCKVKSAMTKILSGC